MLWHCTPRKSKGIITMGRPRLVDRAKVNRVKSRRGGVLECHAVSRRKPPRRLVPQRTEMVWSGRTKGVHGRGWLLGDYPAAWKGICDMRVFPVRRRGEVSGLQGG